MKSFPLTSLMFVLGLLAFVGCGKMPATVSGKITLDGNVLPNADISFRSTAADGTVAYGRSDASGNYQLNTGTNSGLTVGNYEVSVVATELQASNVAHADPVPKILTPTKYSNTSTSGFTADVKSGPNKFDFDLKSTP